MINESELLNLYRNYSDQELVTLFSNNEGYSEEAKIVIYKVVEEKGGIETLSSPQTPLNNQFKKESPAINSSRVLKFSHAVHYYNLINRKRSLSWRQKSNFQIPQTEHILFQMIENLTTRIS